MEQLTIVDETESIDILTDYMYFRYVIALQSGLHGYNISNSNGIRCNKLRIMKNKKECLFIGYILIAVGTLLSTYNLLN